MQLHNKLHTFWCIPLFFCKRAAMNNLNKIYLKPATPILHEWYSLIVDKRNNPDFVAISLYAEIFGWFRNLYSVHTDYQGNNLPEIIDNQLVISYNFLSNKLNLSSERIRKAFVRLESLNLLFRAVKYTEIDKQSRNNRLFISFNTDYFDSCFRNSETDIRVGRDEFFHNAESTKVIKVSPLHQGDYIKNKNIIKNRSMKSNIIDNKNSKKKWPGNKPKALVKFGKPQKLADFYPLEKKDVEELQYKSGREFNKQAMNEILKDMGKKLTKPEFWSRKGFIAYMSEAFKYEKRDAVKISNETFQIRANETKEEQQERIEEEYLTKLENNLQVSPEWHFKKKLASVLERSKAYNLLISLTAVTLEKKGKVRLKLSKNVELSPTDKKIILQQAKATHEKYENGEYIGVNSIELQVKQDNQYKQNNKKEEKKRHQQMPKTLWGRVRQRLQKIYGEDIDRSWFSNLQSEEDKEKKEIKLIYSSGFYQDWIERNYLETMKQIAKEQGSVILSISETTA